MRLFSLLQLKKNKSDQILKVQFLNEENVDKVGGSCDFKALWAKKYQFYIKY